MLVVIYLPVVLTGKSLQSPIYYPNTVLPSGAYGYEGRKPFSAFSVDASGASFSEHPLNKIIGDMYRNLTLPLWNPYKGVGEPLPEQLGSSAFFPYQVLEDIAPIWLWDFFALGRLLIAGFFTFLFLRLLKFSRIGALFGGMLFMLSGSMTWFMGNEPFSNPAMMLPILLWSVELVMQRATARSVTAVACATGLLLLAGPPMVSIYNLLLAGAFFLLRLVARSKDDGPRAHSAAAATLGALLGLGLAAPLILSFFDFLSQVNVLRGGTGLSSVSVSNSLFILFPGLSYFPTEYRFITNGLWDSAGSYLGMIPLILILLGALCFTRIKQGRKIFWFFTAFGTLILLKNYGLFPATLLGRLPLLNTIWSPRWASPVWTFSLTVAAVSGFEVIRRHGKELREAFVAYVARLKFSYLMPIAGGCALFVGIGYAYYHLLFFLGALPYISKGVEGYALSGVLFYIGALLALVFLTGYVLLKFDAIPYAPHLVVALSGIELWLSVPRGYDSLALLMVPMLLALGTVVFFIRRETRWVIVCAGLFLVSSVIVDYASPFGLPERYDPYTVPPYVLYLQSQEGNYRSMGTYGILMPNIAGAFGLQDFRHVSGAIVKHVYSFKRSLLETDEHPFWFLDNPEPLKETDTQLFSLYCGSRIPMPNEKKRDLKERLPYYSLLGIKYFLVPQGRSMSDVYDVGSAGSAFPLVYDEEVRIYENPGVLPRAFIAHVAVPVESYQSAHHQLAAMAPENLRTTVTIEGDDLGELAPAHGTEAALITKYEPNRVAIQAELTAPGILTLTDSFYPGWTVYVDGKPLPILRIDGSFRGVALPSGKHEVIFEYRPVHFNRGLGLLAASIIALGFLFLAPRSHTLYFIEVIIIGALVCMIIFFYGQGIVMYAQNWSDIHADVWQRSSDNPAQNIVSAQQKKHLEFISQHIGSLTSNFERGITGIDDFRFLPGRTDWIAVDYRNTMRERKRVLIEIITQENIDRIENIHTRNIVQYIMDDYIQRSMIGSAPSGSIPQSLSDEFKRSEILDLILFYWKDGDTHKLGSTLYLVKANYIQNTEKQWLFQEGGTKPAAFAFTDGVSYDCDDVSWENIPRVIKR